VAHNDRSTPDPVPIAKRLAEAMAGSVQCQSTLGAGATFTLRLPVCPPAEPIPAKAARTIADKAVPTSVWNTHGLANRA